MAKRKPGCRVGEVILSTENRDALVRVAEILDLDLATYMRLAVIRAVADDLVRLAPLEVSSAVCSVPATRGSAGQPVPATQWSAGGAAGAPPGTPVALSGCMHPEKMHQEQQHAAPEEAAPGEENPDDWERLEGTELGEAIDARIAEIMIRKAVTDPAALREKLRREFQAKPWEGWKALDRRDERAEKKPKGLSPRMRAGLDPV